MISFIGKKILLFSPYGATKHYGENIRIELEHRGAIVISYDERPSQNTWMKIIIRLFKKKIPQIFDWYIQKVINANKGTEFDYILICRGEAFTPYTIKHLRRAFTQAKIILYFWDIFRCADVRANIAYADKAMSFDPQDVEENEGLQFRPTFYVREYTKVQKCVSPINDVVFIGTLHSSRYITINTLETKLKNQGINLFSYLYVPSRLVYIKDFIIKFPYISLRRVNFKPINLSDTINVLNNSKAILDINYTSQKSLSTRAYEAMAAKRKYITTNPEVVNYDFYDPQNIAVIDIDNPIIHAGFLSSPFKEIPEDILYKYSVSGLVDDLFNNL